MKDFPSICNSLLTLTLDFGLKTLTWQTILANRRTVWRTRVIPSWQILFYLQLKTYDLELLPAGLEAQGLDGIDGGGAIRGVQG